MPVARVRVPATVVGALCVAAVGLLITGGHLQAVIVTVALGAILVGASRAVSDSDWRDRLALLVMLAFALRVIVANLLHDWSVEAGRGGFITGDDRLYAELAWSWAEHQRSPRRLRPSRPAGSPKARHTRQDQ